MWQQILLGFPGEQFVSIGIGAQHWKVSFTKHYDQNLGGSLITTPVSPLKLQDALNSKVGFLNHGAPLTASKTQEWIINAVSANSYIPDHPPQPTRSSSTMKMPIFIGMGRHNTGITAQMGKMVVATGPTTVQVG